MMTIVRKKSTVKKDTQKKIRSFFFNSGLFLAVALQTHFALACCFLGDTSGDKQIDEIARAITSTYDQLKAGGCPDFDPTSGQPIPGCSGDVLTTWKLVRALVHTSNQIENGQGPTTFSLGIRGKEFADALRWNAGEEFSSQETISTGFSNNQLSNLTSRISALRRGNSGFSFNGMNSTQQQTATLTNNHSFSGLNSGDEAWAKLGGFLNASYSSGNLDPSVRADAFDFDGTDVNGGLDYRINDQWTIGALLAYATQDADFDSSKSTVDGTVEMAAISVSPFVLYQGEKWFYSASVGYQTSQFDTNRRITFQSNNPAIPSPDTVAISSNDAQTLSTNISGGYSFAITDKLTLEPSLSLNHQSLTIDEFTEKDKNNSGFNLLVREQDFSSVETVLGVKTQYVFSNNLGVFMPFVDLQAIAQHENKARRINAVYANIASSVSEDAEFKLLTDDPDSSYGTYAVGVASVLRGARQGAYGSAAGGGIQAFVNYRAYFAKELYSQSTFTAGVRYEF